MNAVKIPFYGCGSPGDLATTSSWNSLSGWRGRPEGSEPQIFPLGF